MWCLDERALNNTVFKSSRMNNTRVSGAAGLPADLQAALTTLANMMAADDERVSSLIDPTQPLVGARAPARLDVMGGIADYSGSAVLQMPLKESTVILCQHNDNHEFTIVSLTADNGLDTQSVSLPMRDFFAQSASIPPDGPLRSEADMKAYFGNLPEHEHWVAYIAGVLTVLMLHCDVRPRQGITIVVQSSVPVAKGVSSSAALEVATMRAMCGLFGVNVPAHRQAVLCQRVENLIVGAPCGLMDQMASSCGQQGALLNMLCQPDLVKEPVELPEELAVWGIDSGIRHAVSGADYGTVRVAAFMGYRYILELAGIAASHVPADAIDDHKWYGYLANVQVSEFIQEYYAKLPECVSGREFLNRFDATTDSVTQIHHDQQYQVRACTAHPIHEHFRVRLFSQLARSAAQASCIDDLATLMGESMYQSHASYSSCGLGCSECDDLVARLAAEGVSNGIYGARITGGGSGGTVAVLAKRTAVDAVYSIAQEYAANAGVGGYVFDGSSDGGSAYPLSATIAT